MSERAKEVEPMTYEQTIEKAFAEWEDSGRLDFDDEPEVLRSPGAGGAFVACWAWVYDDDRVANPTFHARRAM